MTNLEWLHSLEPKELSEWFAAEHVDTRAERTCRNEDDDYDVWFKCSECGLHSHLEIMSGGYDVPNYCPSCGAKVVDDA